jgi:hypothetical protein
MEGSFVTYHIFLGPRPMRQLVAPRSRAVGGMQPRMKLSTLATESRGRQYSRTQYDMDALTDAGITESEPILITLRRDQCVVFVNRDQ